MRKERGAITIITLTTILFMLAFLISTYVIVANRRQAQAEIKRETKNIYENDVNNIDEIYNSYFATADEVIPIFTAEQLLKVGTGEEVLVDNKIYTFSTTKSYKLMASIDLDVNTYLTEYPTMFTEVDGTNKWIGIEEQLPSGIFNFNLKTITEIDTANNERTHEGIVYTFAYTGDYDTFTVPYNGTYKVELWGAQGGRQWWWKRWIYCRQHIFGKKYRIIYLCWGTSREWRFGNSF